MRPQTAKADPARESLLQRLARLFRRKRRTPPPSPTPLRIEENPTDKKSGPWSGPPPM